MSQCDGERRWLVHAVVGVVVVAIVSGVAFWVGQHHLDWSTSEALALATLAGTVLVTVVVAWLTVHAGRSDRDSRAVSMTQQTHGSNSPAVSSGPRSTTIINYGTSDSGNRRFAELEIVPSADGEVTNVEPLTETQMSRLVWGRSADNPYNVGRHRRETAQRLAEGQPNLRKHLEQAMQLVWYCGDHEDILARRIGLLSATIAFDVIIRNTGTESAGIKLTTPADPRPIPNYSPANPDYNLKYAVTHADTARYEVAPGTPVSIRSELQLRIWFEGDAKYDPVGYLRLARDLAETLVKPIDFVSVTARLDDGQVLTTTHKVVVPDPAASFAVQPPDIDALNHHLEAIDAAIQPDA